MNLCKTIDILHEVNFKKKKSKRNTLQKYKIITLFYIKILSIILFSNNFIIFLSLKLNNSIYLY